MSENPPIYGRCWECQKVLKRRRMGYSQRPTITAPNHTNEETGERCKGSGVMLLAHKTEAEMARIDKEYPQ